MTTSELRLGSGAPDKGRVRRAVGCMTGTSIDSLDVTLAEITGTGLTMHARFIRGHTAPLGDLVPRLRALAEQQPMTASEIATLSREFSTLHVDAIRSLMGDDHVPADLVCVHGQTVYHKPPVSWQLLTPAIIAHELGVPVVHDLRAADLAKGGQGAPITPIADWVFFGHLPGPLGIVNLGGFCNVTVLPGTAVAPAGSDLYTPATYEHLHEARTLRDGRGTDQLKEMRGKDVCACNQLLDAIARKLLNREYDEDGQRALAGEVRSDALEDLEGVLNSQAGSRRSLGTGDESGEWISRWRSRVGGDDLAATACEGIAKQIAEATFGCRTLLLAGGGARNKALAGAIESCGTSRVETLSAHGVPGEFREAAEFAVLGALCQDRVPITLPNVTGVRIPAPIAGCWTIP
jgi:1,6-anhydro-N-acetylmuramate kinase